MHKILSRFMAVYKFCQCLLMLAVFYFIFIYCQSTIWVSRSFYLLDDFHETIADASARDVVIVESLSL